MKIKIQMWQKISKTIIAKFDDVFLFFFGVHLGKSLHKRKADPNILIKLETFKTTKLKGNKQTNLGLDFSDIQYLAYTHHANILTY